MFTKKVRLLPTRIFKSALAPLTRTSSTYITIKNLTPPPPTTHEPEPKEDIPDSAFELTSEEISLVTGSPFLSQMKIANPRDRVPAHVQAVAQYVPIENGFLKQVRYPDAPTPFQVYTSPNNMVQTNNVSRFPRLSVTRLLTQSWCELRSYYETYSQIQIKETDAMRRGKEIHLDLEMATHPPIDMTTIEEAIPQQPMTKEDTFADMMRVNVLRLTQLLVLGSAREIYVHGYINDQDGVVSGRSPRAGDTTVTGIVDLLVLRCRDPSHPLQKDLRKVRDMDSFISTSENLLNDYKHLYVLSVCDVKTRRWRKVPTQDSVIEGSKQQVMVYETLMKVMGQSPQRAMEFWQEYCLRKGIDIDAPVTPELALSWVCIDDFLLSDFRKLRDGVEIFNSGIDMTTTATYDLTEMKAKIQNPTIIEQVDEFIQPWSKALTPRYFLIRLSQLFNIIAQIPGGDLRIQYYCNSEIFKEIRFPANPGTVDTVAKDALGFWMGQRPPKTMEKTYTNMRGKCNFCEFADFCGWKREAEERFGEAGQAYRSC